MAPRGDDELLLSGDPEDFAVFYRRHARDVLGYFARRVRNSEVAADLTAETFAAAVVARRRFHAASTPAAAWLYGIAGHKLADFQRRGRVEDRARQRLGMRPLTVTYDDEELVRAAADDAAATLLDTLPSDQREAVHAHIVDEESYRAMARRLGAPESVLRKRVSRGLRELRGRLEPPQ